MLIYRYLLINLSYYFVIFMVVIGWVGSRMVFENDRVLLCKVVLL